MKIFCLNKTLKVCVKTSKARQRGFTLPEVLAAMIFVALVIPVALHGIMLSNKASVNAERKLIATRLADRVLNELIITENWQRGANSGEFGEQWPGYRWMLIDENWPMDNMQQLTIVVYYTVQGQEKHIQLSTLVDGSANEIESDIEEESA